MTLVTCAAYQLKPEFSLVWINLNVLGLSEHTGEQSIAVVAFLLGENSPAAMRSALAGNAETIGDETCQGLVELPTIVASSSRHRPAERHWRHGRADCTATFATSERGGCRGYSQFLISWISWFDGLH